MLRNVETCRVETLRHVAGLVDTKEEERYAARRLALQGGKALACLLERHGEGGRQPVDVVLRFLCEFEKAFIGHQQCRCEIVGKLDTASCNAALGVQRRVVRDRMQDLAELDETQNMRHLEGPVRKVQRLGKPQLPAVDVMNAKRVPHFIDRLRDHLNVVSVTEARFQHHVHFIGRAGLLGRKLFGRTFQRVEMVPLPPEKVMDGRFGRQGEKLLRHLLMAEPHDVVESCPVVPEQGQEISHKGRCVVERRLKFVDIRRATGKDGVLEGMPEIGKHGRAVVGDDVLPVDAILLRQRHQYRHGKATLVSLQHVDVGCTDAKRLRH